MPPRKKARLTPTPSVASAPSPATEPPSVPSFTDSSALPIRDAWTPEQETALFKALIRYKPTGMHKHFHMLSISSYMRSHGHCAPSKDKHTRIPGIWSKLSGLYDLDALDERENAHSLGIENSNSDESADEQHTENDDEEKQWNKSFELPDDDDNGFDDEMWARRLHGDNSGKSSPVEMPFLLGRSIEPSPAPSKRGSIARFARGGAKSALKKHQRRQSQGRNLRGSKTVSRASVESNEPAEDEQEDDDEDDAVSEDAEEDDENDDDDEEEEEESEKDDESQVESQRTSSPPAKGTRRNRRSTVERAAPMQKANSRGGRGARKK